jgi:hypothetical protein
MKMEIVLHPAGDQFEVERLVGAIEPLPGTLLPESRVREMLTDGTWRVVLKKAPAAQSVVSYVKKDPTWRGPQ